MSILQKKVGFVAFGFGEPADLKPNREIARWGILLARAVDATVVITDRDVSPHLSGAGIVVKEIDPTRVPTTWRLAASAIAEAKNQRLTTLYVVAAPCHIWHCLRDLRWAALDQGIEVILVAKPIEARHQYDHAATTWFTRSPLFWWPAELAYRFASITFPGWYMRTRA